MLVLSRRIGERIVIGPDIVISVEDIRHDCVRIGIKAPVEMPVHRSEIADKIERERRERDENQCH